MSITHHPGEELLLGYASGAANEAVALLVASHIALCAACRAKVRGVEAAGGSLLSDVAPVALGQNAYQAVLARLDEPTAAILRGANLGGDVPAPLQPYAGANFADVPWRHITTGLAHYPLLSKGGTRARLIRAMPGAAVATHTHRGEEWTLVLTGSYHDTTGRYAAGDVQSTTPELSHEPKADDGPVCINLAVTDAPLVFSGLVHKLIGKLHGF